MKSKLSFQISLAVSIIIAFFFVLFLPSSVKKSPSETLVGGIKKMFVFETTQKTISENRTIKQQSIPTNIPTAIPSNIPTTTIAVYPTKKTIPTTYTSPIVIQPTVSPTATLTIRKPNYSKIAAMVANPPQIGCKNGSTSGCPIDNLYQTPVYEGLGWATYYGDEKLSGYNIVAEVIHNNNGISIEAARKFIDDNFMEKQSNLTPDQARQTGKVIAYGATRSPNDLWKIKYVFGIDDPQNPRPYFIGRIMIIDCAAPNDWSGYIATWTYGYKNWNSINWIVDLSKNGFVQLPTGLSGLKGNTGEGRPGVVLIDESRIDQMIY